MNIFVTDPDPVQSAQNLPDKHIVKMPLETCQMLAIIFSDWYYGVGQLHKRNGQPYATKNGAFRNHPCTQWAAANQHNLAWLITHGYALCAEYHSRYDKVHTCHAPIIEAELLYEKCFDDCIDDSWRRVTSFTRAMPDHLKSDFTITTTTAYQRYLNTKPWVATNYLRIPTRKPYFIKSTMTTSLPVYDFSSTPEDRAKKEAEAQVKQLEASLKKDAPAVTKAKQGLVPAKKPAAKKSGKAGRIVGISKDENEFIQEVLQMIADDPELGASNPNYVKIQARYNK